jgi:hypothetical protein
MSSARTRTATRALLVLALLGVAAPARAQLAPSGVRRLGPALDLDGGGGRASDGHGWGGFGRLGAGVYLINDEQYAGLTATAAVASWRKPAFGLSAAWAHVETGLGATGGGEITTGGVVGFQAGLSLSVLHVEGQLLLDTPRTKALVFYLRIPLGLLYGVLKTRI